jgi:peptide/nickel transport system permease protein
VARQILIRIGQALLTMLALITIVFFMIRLTGDPTYALVSPDAPPELRDQLRKEFGLDQPVTTQYLIFLGDLAQGDLGTSFHGRQPVSSMIIQRLPGSLVIAIPAFLLMLLVGIPVGIYSAYHRGGVLDRVARAIAAVGQATPSFSLGVALILIFAIQLRWLPSAGNRGPESIILPVITVSVYALAGLIRLLRSSMIETLGSEYIAFHRMKGLPESRVLWKHALRNAGLTTLTYMGIVLAGLLTGSVIAETLFAFPGVGRLMIESVHTRDFPTIQGVLLFFAFTYIIVNLVVDIIYTLLNPRLRT